VIRFLTLREARTTLPRVGPYMLSIALGVAALVSIHSFRQDVSRSVREEAQVLMGADLKLEGSAPLSPALAGAVDSLAGAGHPSATVVSAVSMSRGIPSEVIRLVQLRAVEGGWPFYGEAATRPEGAWARIAERGRVLVDEAILTQLSVAVGDSIGVGSASYEIAGVVVDIPTEVGLQTAIGPRVWMSRDDLDDAEVIGFGSLARYATYVVIPELGERAAVETRYDEIMAAEAVTMSTAVEQARDLTEAVGFLGRYLALVGLAALLLGGVGVGSAIQVFVRERLPSIAVLRCMGATQNAVFAVYLFQAAALGLAGAVVGAALGVVVQQLLPGLLSGLLPVAIRPVIDPTTIAAGIGVGVWVSVVFGLLPLLGIREVPPLRALRVDAEEGPGANRWLRAGAVALLALSVVGTSIVEAPRWQDGLAFAAALAISVGVLWVVAGAAVGWTRRLLPDRAPWALRQGVSSLFRPGNQTVAVVLALGFGTFVVGTVMIVQGNLARSLAVDAGEERANLLLFDVQSDQREGIEALFPDSVRSALGATPLVPSRIASIRGIERRAFDSIPLPERPSSWAVRREFRNSWRSELGPGEELVEGAWWPDAPEVESGVLRISMERDVAEDLKVGVGDRVGWDVAGRRIETEVVSLRTVDWSRFETNFFVLFEPGAIDDLPATWVLLGRAGGPGARATLQGEIVRAYPNVSMIDLGRVQAAVDRILSNVDRAIRFLAGFAGVAGLLVLAGALAVTRGERLREAALLRTLGADRDRLIHILGVEYALLGGISATVGLALASLAGGLVVTQLFRLDFDPGFGRILLIAAGLVSMTLVVGWAGSRRLLSHPPLEVLREGE
jgi:putative ABC transport system permease protein